MKYLAVLFLVFSLSLTVLAFAEEQAPVAAVAAPAAAVEAVAPKVDNPNAITGKIEQIAEDGSFVVVNGSKIITTQEMVDENYLMEGDEVIVNTEKTDQGIKAVSIDFADEGNDEEDYEEVDIEETVEVEAPVAEAPVAAPVQK